MAQFLEETIITAPVLPVEVAPDVYRDLQQNLIDLGGRGEGDVPDNLYVPLTQEQKDARARERGYIPVYKDGEFVRYYTPLELQNLYSEFNITNKDELWRQTGFVISLEDEEYLQQEFDILADSTTDDESELIDSTLEEIKMPVVEQPYSFIDEAGDFIEENVNDAWEWVVDKVEGGIDTIKNMTPQDWGDVVRTILETAGIDLPSGDIQSILNGGYGVMWPSAGGSVGSPSGIFGTGGAIFIPGLPGGFNPGSVTIGTIQDILEAESIGDWATGVKDTVWHQVVNAATDPIGVLSTLYENGSLPGGLAGILTAGVWGQEIVDWASGLLEEEEEETTPPITSVEEEPEKEVPKTNLVGESEDFGTQPVEETKETVEETVDEVVEETVVDNGEPVEQGLTFGGGSQVFEQGEIGPREQQVINMFGNMFTAAGGDDQVEEQIENQVEEQVENQVEEQVEDNPFTFGGEGMIVEDPLTSNPPYTITDDPDQEEEEVEDAFTVTPPVSSGSSASSARRQGMFDPVQYGITYQAPTVQSIIQSPQTDYIGELNKIINKGMLV